MISGLICAVVISAGFPGLESRADYQMEVRLEPDSSMIHGHSEILFTNGVDFSVDTLWLHLYPNAYRDVSTAFGQDLEAVGRYYFRASPESQKGWVELSEWSLNGKPVDISVDGSLGFISLDSTLYPGETVLLQGDFIVKIPAFWSRMGHLGDTYQITQWYPKMCVLDENGWHRGRYHWRGEFYSDFGNYFITLDVPENFITAATGSVKSISFSKDSLRRSEIWEAYNVHDFAWSVSPDYTLREHTYVYPESLGADSVRVHLVLLDDDSEHWSDVPAVIDSTLLYYGEWYVPYPYDDLWVVEPVILMAGGMEYPQFIFSAADVPMTRALEMVTSHEVGHQWFYGMLGNDEVNEAWLDEGMNTFSELRYMQRRHGFHGNMSTAPEWIMEISDQDISLMTYVSGTAAEKVPVLSDATSAGDGSHPTGFTYYTKPAFFLRMLQRQIGEEDFDRIMSIYFDRFMYHHPHTDDFQAVVEEVTARSWESEFDFWLRGTGNADVRIISIEESGDSTTVVLEGDVPHTLELDLLFVSGGDSLFTETSISPVMGDTVTVAGQWSSAIVDPFLCMPDRAPWNNAVPVLSQIRPMLLPFPRPTHYSLWILPFPSYAAGSWRGEILCMSAAVPSYMGGPYTWSAHASVPFESDNYSSWGAAFHAPLFRGYRRSLYLSTGISRGYGTGSASLGADYFMGGRVATDTHLRISFDLELFSVEDTTVYGGCNIQEGSGYEFSAGLSAADKNYDVSWKAAFHALASPGWDEDSYARLDAELDITSRIAGSYLARTRIYAGRIAGDAPVHVFLRPGGGLFARGITGAFLPPDGLLSPQEHYYVRSGPALPGYQNSPVRARAALTVEQRFPVPFLPVEIFGGAGWLADGFNDFSEVTFLANGGIAVRIAMLEALFPVWVSDPVDGESSWEFRWRIGLSPAGFPDLY
ncbi:MAG: M1 family metallopeptidase [Candidatus Fermentibacteria bacterium]